MPSDEPGTISTLAEAIQASNSIEWSCIERVRRCCDLIDSTIEDVKTIDLVCTFAAKALDVIRSDQLPKPIPMRIHCPDCGTLHLDEGEFATKIHHTHACQHCGAVFRPAVVPTVGVRFLPGFKNGQ